MKVKKIGKNTTQKKEKHIIELFTKKIKNNDKLGSLFMTYIITVCSCAAWFIRYTDIVYNLLLAASIPLDWAVCPGGNLISS